jgi:hypothetical protein
MEKVNTVHSNKPKSDIPVSSHFITITTNHYTSCNAESVKFCKHVWICGETTQTIISGWFKLLNSEIRFERATPAKGVILLPSSTHRKRSTSNTENLRNIKHQGERRGGQTKKKAKKKGTEITYKGVQLMFLLCYRTIPWKYILDTKMKFHAF